MDKDNKLYNIFKKVITEEKDATFSYGCIMLYYDINKSDWDKIQDIIDDDDVYTEEGDRSFGREDEPHITLKFGLLESVTDSEVKEILNSEPPTDVKFEGVSLFENDDFEVLKFDVSGEMLNKINKKLCELPNEDSYPTYKPHMTISYIKKGKGKAIIEKINGEFNIDKLTEGFKKSKYVFSKPDGSESTFELKND